MTQQHIIRRQVLDAAIAGSESEGLAVQRRLADMCDVRLRPALERVFDRLAPGGEHWTIDRLVIDAGAVALDDLERDLSEAVAGAVERQLKEWAAARPVPPAAAARSERAGETAPPGDPANEIERRSGAQSLQDAFFHFLETGLLPWWFRLPEGVTLEDAVRQSLSSAAPSSDLESRLAQAMTSPAARTRLVRQFSPAFLQTLLASLAPAQARAVQAGILGSDGAAGEAARALQEVFAELAKHDIPAAMRKRFTEQLWQAAFVLAAASRRVTAASLLADWIATQPAAERPDLLARLVQRWPALKDLAAQPHRGGSPRPGTPAASKPDTYAPVDLADGMHVDCAGLVLLHPFLPRLFETLGIAAGDKLVAPDRALALLHHLATGERQAPEYALLLPKLLCGLALGAPAAAPVPLTQSEEDEAAALLQAVIGHWDALGGTSIDGLRGTFLVRPGKLTERDGDHVLQVETRSFDILLDRLPWGIGAVQLPWMKKLLWVEWRF